MGGQGCESLRNGVRLVAAAPAATVHVEHERGTGPGRAVEVQLSVVVPTVA